MTVGHDGEGRGKGWFCDKATLTPSNKETQLVFQAQRWFDQGCDDRAIERELEPFAEVSVLPDEKDNDLISSNTYLSAP